MEVLLGVFIGIAGVLGIIFSRLITTFFHELGHAIPALFFTEGPVVMYVGSYGNSNKSIKLRLGRLTIYTSFIIWNLDIGMCTHSRQANVAHTFAIILGGPLFSLLTALILLVYIMRSDLSDGVIFVLAIFIISAIFDFFVNVIPREIPTRLDDGEAVHNDGWQFRELYRKSKMPQDYFDIMDLISNGRNDDAATLALIKTENNPERRYYHEVYMDALRGLEDPHRIIAAFEKYLGAHDPRSKYLAQWAEAKIKVHEYDEVVKTLTQVIYEGKGNYDLHFLRGKALVELGEYHDAMRDFHALTLGEVEDPLALANRAYCQFRLGYEDEAREDVLEAVENGTGNMGEIYYLAGVINESHDNEKALEYYKKAEALKYDHHALPFNISRIEKFKGNV